MLARRRGHTSPWHLTWASQVKVRQSFGKSRRGSLRADGRDARLPHFAQGRPLRQRRRDHGRDGPERLRRRLATTRSRRAITLGLDLLVKGVKQGVIVWGCAQYTVGDGEAGDMRV